MLMHTFIVQPLEPASSSYLAEKRRAEKDLFVKTTPPTPETLLDDMQKLESVTRALSQSSAEMHPNILDAYRDLFLSDNFLFIMNKANETESDVFIRSHYRAMTEKAVELTLEVDNHT
jgi:hypothetical protein